MAYESWSIAWGEGWGPLRLGTPGAELIAALESAGIELDRDPDDPTWADLMECMVELRFAAEPPHPLVEIAISEPDVALGGETPIGKSLPEALRIVGARSSDDTLWRLDADSRQSLPTRDPSAVLTLPEAALPEELLDRGTLWIRGLGLGLWMEGGQVVELFLRRPGDVPRLGCGPLMPEQLELAGRADLRQHLRARARHHRGGGWIGRVATLALMAGIGVLVWLGFRDQQRWHAAPVVEGTCTAVEEFATEGGLDVYVVEYRDGADARHTARWTLADLYVPLKVGDPVEVRYLPEAPDRPLGPFALRNVGFFQYVPYVLGLLGAYVAVLCVAGWLRR